MSGHGVAEPAEIAILSKAVSDYRTKHEIARTDDREQIAIKVMDLFGQGIIDPDRLSIELEKVGQGKPGLAG